MAEEFIQGGCVCRVADPLPVDLLLRCRRSRLLEVGAVEYHSRIGLELMGSASSS